MEKIKPRTARAKRRFRATNSHGLGAARLL
jgi:hypothetical protein